MKMIIPALLFSIAFLVPSIVFSQVKDDLDAYIQRLRDDHNGARKETGFLSAGSDFLYAQDYFDAGNYSSSVWYYKEVLKKEKDNPYANYLLGIALLKQEDKYKKQEAMQYLENSFRLNLSLKERYKKDIPVDAVNTKPDPEPDVETKEKIAGNENKTSVVHGAVNLETYIEKLKYSRSTGGAETAMNSPGQTILYGIEHFESNEYRSAESNFSMAVSLGANDPFVHYLLGVSLAAQDKHMEAKQYLDKAFAGNPELKKQYANDSINAKSKWKEKEESKKVKTTPAPALVYGGKLIFGNYTCSETVYNGPNVNPAFSYKYMGYFELKRDGTYRWLNDGVTGRYKYDAETGNITWLSGHFYNNAKASKFRINEKSGQVTVSFTDTYRWECGCKK